jgi:pSer/pThr/pTyr-binding forkhead associated (FHA) protein
MPYILVNSERQDPDCRKLSGPLIIGRAPDCQVAVRDILLSRRHCRIERSPHGWLLIDLNSKNGTVVNGEKLLSPRLLKDNDIVRMGRSRMIFRHGEPDPIDLQTPGPRPVDPNEALAGTLAGFTLVEPGESEPTPANMPSPRPKPREPAAFEREELHEMLTAIASSSWDSIYAEARQPLRKQSSTAVLERPQSRPMRPRSPIDLSLQAGPMPVRIQKIIRRRERPIALILAAIPLALGILSMGQWTSAPRPTAPPTAKIGPIDQTAWTEVAKDVVVAGW